MRTHMRIVFAAAIAATLVMAAVAAGNGVKSGELKLKPNQSTFEGLADMGIAVEAKGDASFSGGGFVFPSNGGGDIDPANGYQGIMGAGGALKFSRASDGAKVKFKNLTVVIHSNKVIFSGSVKDLLVKIANIKGYDISGNDTSFQLKNGAATLSRGAAKVLKQTFDFPFRRGIPLGDVDIKAKLSKNQVQE